jgi:metal-responsive CopG/Arc/MetJ family transcriptional regulator
MPLSLRFPAKLLARLDAVAKATKHPRTDVILHLVRWGLDEYERQRAEEESTKKTR